MCLNRCLHKLLKEWWINTIHISIIYNQTRKRMAKSCPRKRDNKEKYKLKKQNVMWTRSWWSFRDYIASSWLWKRTVHSRLYFEVTEFSRFQIKTWNFISQRSIEFGNSQPYHTDPGLDFLYIFYLPYSSSGGCRFWREVSNNLALKE